MTVVSGILRRSVKILRCELYDSVKLQQCRFYEGKSNLIHIDMNKLEEICTNLPVLANAKDFEIVPALKQVLEWRSYVSEYMLTTARRSRTRFLLGSYLKIENQERNIETNKELVHILGWLTELHNTCIVILDDFVDRSETRRGIQCWHLTAEGSSSCLYDAVLLKETINDVLKRYFNESNLYRTLCDSVSKTSFQLLIGHKLEIETVIKGKHNIDYLTPERFRVTARYKTSPFAKMSLEIAMYLANITDFKLYHDVNNIIHEIGYWWQMQDDYQDTYQQKDNLNSIESDIATGRCTWLITTALQTATPSQKDVLIKNYGVPEEEAVENVKVVFDEVGIHETYHTAVNVIFESILKKLKKISHRRVEEAIMSILAELQVKFK